MHNLDVTFLNRIIMFAKLVIIFGKLYPRVTLPGTTWYTAKETYPEMKE